MQWVWEELSNKFVDSPTVKWSKSITGWIARAVIPPSSGGTSTPTLGQPYTFQNCFKDYIVATDSNGKSVRIAKLPENRCSIQSATFYGTGIAFAYPQVSQSGVPLPWQYRAATLATGVEYEVYIPPYTTNTGDPLAALVYAQPGNTGVAAFDADSQNDGLPPGIITLQEVSARAWTRLQNQAF